MHIIGTFRNTLIQTNAGWKVNFHKISYMKADKIHTYIDHEHRVEADTEGAGPADGVQVTEETQGQSYTGTRQHDQRRSQVVCILQQPDQ